MKNKSIFKLIGLMHASSSLVYGFDSIMNIIFTHKLKCIIVGSSCSLKTIKRIQDKALTYNKELFIVDESDYTIAQALGKEKVKIIGLTDQGFYKKIKLIAQGE